MSSSSTPLLLLVSLSLTSAKVIYSEWEISLPRVRFQAWDDLSNTLEDLAESVGYRERNWEAMYTNPIEEIAFGDLATTNCITGDTSDIDVRAPNKVLQEMGMNEENWDCWVNHFGGYDWSDMVEYDVAEAYIALGWNERAWNSLNERDYPDSYGTEWDDLNDAEQQAAANLCYIPETWDELEFDDFIDSSEYIASTEPWEKPPAGFGICFPGSATVVVEGVGATSISQLQLGDQVLVDNEGNYETVYTFGHYEPNSSKTDFTKITTETGEELTLSPNHMVKTTTTTTPAVQIKKGDSLIHRTTSTTDAAIVKSVKTVQLQNGMYAPFTSSGYLVVDDMVVSNYVSLDAQQYLHINGMKTPFTHQWIAHSINAPHRMYCQYIDDCTNETYNDRGISNSIAVPFAISEYILTSSSNFMTLFSMMAVIMLSTVFTSLEFILTTTPAMAVTVAGSATIFFLRRSNNNKNLTV